MATKKTAAKKATPAKKAKEEWYWFTGTDDYVDTSFTSYEAALKDAKQVISDRPDDFMYNNKPVKIKFMQVVKEMEFTVKTEVVEKLVKETKARVVFN